MKFRDLFPSKTPAPITGEPSSVCAVNDEKVLATDLDLETPYWGYSAKEYCFSDEFSMLNEKIEQMARGLFNSLADEQIANTIERHLADILKTEMFNLSKQRINHQDVIHKLALRRVSFEEGYRKKLMNLENEYERICSECEKIICESKKNKWEDYTYEN